MRILFIAKQKKNVDSFRTTIARLLEAGHQVRLAMQDRDGERDRKLEEELAAFAPPRRPADPPALSLLTAPSMRGDAWRLHAPLIRRLRDWTQYLGPRYAGAQTLRQRALDRLAEEIGGRLPAIAESSPGPPAFVERLQALLVQVEALMPSDPLHEEFVSREKPDVVLVTPGVHFGSAQTDFIKSAKAAGIPVWMLVFSWDNLSTKGALHVAPDLMFVWNERQRREAAELHGFPPEQVIAVGAPRFDEFFALRPLVPRPRFCAPLGLDPGVPILLYVCSSPFVAQREMPFIEQWLSALRSSSDPLLRDCNVLVRPHPDIALVDESAATIVRWPELPRAQGWVSRPFADPRALVLRTTYATPQAFFECLYHSAAVVGLNTSAELEAGIVGRPVFTVVAQHGSVTGQANTLHFHYLLREQGGFVVSAADMPAHVAHLSAALQDGSDGDAIRAFVGEFLRPRGDRPVAEVLAEAIVDAAQSRVAGDVGERQVSGRRAVAAAIAGAGADLPVEPTKVLRIAYPGSSLQVLATPETRKFRRSGQLLLDPALVAWLDEHVQPGDVVYDIGAGIGECSLVAAAHRGALAIAIEPGFAAFKRLCDNILRNQCGRSVVPLTLAIGERAGLLELEYAADAAGEDRHTLKGSAWRTRPDAAEAQYVQPVIADTLDEIVARYRLPRPHHVRIRSAREADAILRGAKATLRDPALKSLLVPKQGSDASTPSYVVVRPEPESRFWPSSW